MNCLNATIWADPVASTSVAAQRVLPTPSGKESIDQTLATILTLVSTSTTGADSSSLAILTSESASKLSCNSPRQRLGNALDTLTRAPSAIERVILLGPPLYAGCTFARSYPSCNLKFTLIVPSSINSGPERPITSPIASTLGSISPNGVSGQA